MTVILFQHKDNFYIKVYFSNILFPNLSDYVILTHFILTAKKDKDFPNLSGVVVVVVAVPKPV